MDVIHVIDARTDSQRRDRLPAHSGCIQSYSNGEDCYSNGVCVFAMLVCISYLAHSLKLCTTEGHPL